MTAYIGKRLLFMIPTLLGITIIVFAVSRIAPGDPLVISAQQAEQIKAGYAEDIHRSQQELYGLDKPVHVQYFQWLWRVVQFDFGDSIKHHRPVIELIKQKLPITLTLNLIAFAIIYSVSVPLGIFSAVKHNQFFDRACSVVLIMLWSLPIMLTAQLLIGYFAGQSFVSWFPPGGLSSIYADELAFFPWLADRLWHLVLPVICLTYTGFAYLTKQVRAGMLENLQTDYVRTAWAKGLPERVVIFKHAFRNSVIGVITIMATLLPAMFSGSVIIERIFSIPGMGLLAFEAVAGRDYNVIMAVATIAGFLNLAGFLLADIAYAMADPRVSFEGVVQRI